uniref:Uncharacterized protein n=1 Tax=Anguilla anguilla TaxID=7936 RepID=A0A0E9SYG0_ANGAN
MWEITGNVINIACCSHVDYHKFIFCFLWSSSEDLIVVIASCL